MTNGRVTIRDVARAAGVSPTTVSHVLNGRGRVGAATRLRVEEEARRLGYRPNPVATNLRRNTFGAFGLALPPRSLNYAFYTDIMVGASEVLFEAGVALSLIPPTATSEEAAALPIDGVIVAEPRANDLVLQGFCDSGLPVVICESTVEALPDNAWTVDLDHSAGIGTLLDHLVSAGATRLAALVVDDVTWWGRNVGSAIEAWELREGMRVRRRTVPFGVSPTAARTAIRRVLTHGRPDGLLVCHEGLGSAAIGVAAHLGRQVPDDVAVACAVDGPDLLTVEPAVTALDLHPREIGQVAARLLLDRPAERTRVVRPTLHVRASTAPSIP